MSILDNVKQMIGGQSGADSAANPAIMGHVMDLVNNPETGGLQGLVQQFHNNGLGSIVTSWVGSEANQAISADQITQVVGQDRLNAIAAKLGIQSDQVSGLLAQHLPSVINKLTPGGNVEQS